MPGDRAAARRVRLANVTPVSLPPAQERRLPEGGKNPYRSAFARDRARLLHSSGLRRLGAKTQVMGPSTDDFVRTRLTHSLEVAQVGRELGQSLGCDPDVVETACLAHDLGHPPFGHNGERALNEASAAFGGFEGNAQTLRLLTRLEPKVVGDDGTPYGLNLTRASLDATVKYPWSAPEGRAGPPLPGGGCGRPTRKFGYYAPDAEAFAWVRRGVPAGRRCLEAQVMDLADDVAYSVHDVEDAIASARLDPAVLRAPRGPHAADVVASTLAWYRPSDLTADDLGAALERLVASPLWPDAFTGSRADLAGLKNLTSQLIGRFCGAVEAATREVAGQGELRRYDADLVVPAATEAEILVLKGVAVHFVMAPRETEAAYLAQRTIVFDLLEALTEAAPAHLEPPFAADWRAADDDAGRMRAVVDQIASLTDHSAGTWHARLRGMLSELF